MELTWALVHINCTRWLVVYTYLVLHNYPPGCLYFEATFNLTYMLHTQKSTELKALTGKLKGINGLLILLYTAKKCITGDMNMKNRNVQCYFFVQHHNVMSVWCHKIKINNIVFNNNRCLSLFIPMIFQMLYDNCTYVAHNYRHRADCNWIICYCKFVCLGFLHDYIFGYTTT